MSPEKAKATAKDRGRSTRAAPPQPGDPDVLALPTGPRVAPDGVPRRPGPAASRPPASPAVPATAPASGSLPFPPAALADELKHLAQAASSMVRGQARAIEDFLLCAGAHGHLLILGVPGTGKTMLAKVLGRLTGQETGRVQFTQDLLPADITGHFVFDRNATTFNFRPGPIFCNILLADEVNRAPAKTQSALLEAMEEHQVTVDGRTFPLPNPFLVMATMNPVDIEGVHHLPAAQMDRFAIRTHVDYPDAQGEAAYLAAPPGPRLGQLKPAAKDLIARLQRQAAAVRVQPEALEYLVRLVRATRSHPKVLLGLSPRASEQVLEVARSMAVLRGRGYVVPDDLQEAFRRCSAHRIHLQPDAEGTSVGALAEDILRSVPTPEMRAAANPDLRVQG